MIGDYDNNIYINEICEFPKNKKSYVVLFQLDKLKHNVCLIGKK